MVDDLVRQSAVVLQDIVFRRTGRYRHLLGDRQDILQVLVRQLVRLGRMVLGDHQAVTRRAWSNIEERKRLVRLIQLHRWDLSIDNFAKDAVGVVRHLGSVSK